MDKLEELKAALWKVTPDEVKEQEQGCKSVGVIAQEVKDIPSLDTITISGLSSIDLSSLSIGSNMGTTIGTSIGSNGTWSIPSSNYTIGNSSNSSLQVTGNAEFEGDITWKGRKLGDFLQNIEDRLAIIQEPTPERLEKFAALKKAYDHYKLMEKLCHDDPEPTK
jgi:hypothetical protein